MKISTLEPLPANSNPFQHDSYNMGTRIGSNVIIMHGNHSDRVCRYLIIVDTITGKRIKIEFEETG